MRRSSAANLTTAARIVSQSDDRGEHVVDHQLQLVAERVEHHRVALAVDLEVQVRGHADALVGEQRMEHEMEVVPGGARARRSRCRPGTARRRSRCRRSCAATPSRPGRGSGSPPARSVHRRAARGRAGAREPIAPATSSAPRTARSCGSAASRYSVTRAVTVSGASPRPHFSTRAAASAARASFTAPP